MTSMVRRLLLAALLVLGAVVWVRINGPVEGRTLVELSENHGFTTGDLLAVLALAGAAVLAWPARGDRSRRR